MSACFSLAGRPLIVTDGQPRTLFLVELEPRIRHTELGCYLLAHQLLPGRAGRLRERMGKQRDAQIRVLELRAGGAPQPIGRKECEHLGWRIGIAAHWRLTRQTRRVCSEVDKRNLSAFETRHRDPFGT